MSVQLSSIDPEKLYAISEISALTGLKKAALRTARRNGLRIRYFSRFAYVQGKDLIDYVIENSRDEKAVPRQAAVRNRKSLSAR